MSLEIILSLSILLLIVITFIFRNIFFFFRKFKYIKCQTVKTNIIINSEHIFDEEILEYLKNDHRKEYHDIAIKQKNKCNSLYKSFAYRNNIKNLKYSLVTTNGCIFNYESNYINGVQNKLLIKILNKIYLKSNVITISTKWGDGIWHFPFESLVALRLFLEKNKNLDNYFLHIDKKNKYIKQWLELINIPIKWENVISGNIFCKNLLICHVDHCGNPSIESTYWLKNRLNIEKSNEQDTVIIIKRCFSRKLRNFDELLNNIKKIPKLKKYQLYLHDDSNLPSLKEQMEMFNRAKIIIGPHGAGGINLIACKENTYFIEFIDKSHVNLCYSRLACILKLNYYGISTKDFIVNLDNLNSIINNIML